MNKSIFKKVSVLSVFCIAMTAFALYTPMTCYGDPIGIDVSPNIINIESERVGEIRILTSMKYSFFVSNGSNVFIYINGSKSVENIRATRDSRGNLILKFNLEDLLVLYEYLNTDGFNTFEVVIVTENGDEYEGLDEDVYIVDKNGP